MVGLNVKESEVVSPSISHKPVQKIATSLKDAMILAPVHLHIILSGACLLLLMPVHIELSTSYTFLYNISLSLNNKYGKVLCITQRFLSCQFVRLTLNNLGWEFPRLHPHPETSNKPVSGKHPQREYQFSTTSPDSTSTLQPNKQKNLNTSPCIPQLDIQRHLKETSFSSRMGLLLLVKPSTFARSTAFSASQTWIRTGMV